MARMTGRWSVRTPQAGRMAEEAEGKVLMKEGEISQRSRRAPDWAEALKWVKSVR